MPQPASAIGVSALPQGVTLRIDGDAAVLEVDPDARPAESVVVSVRGSGTRPSTALTVRVGAGARLALVEDLRGGGEWRHAFSAELGPEATLAVTRLERADADASLTLTHRATLGEGARAEWQIVTIGGARVADDLVVTLAGREAASTTEWVFYARGREHYRLAARTVFAAGNGGGEMTMRGVAEEAATAAVRGMIDIEPSGAGTDTYLTQEVLMLDPTAKVDAVPGLEIKCNDVKASHSATVSRVTPEDVFYFASRGIPEREARRMFVAGYLGDVVARADAAVREEILVAIERKYGAAPEVA